MDPGDSPLVVPLSRLDRDSIAVAGGKGANLGELMAAGVDVPDGFVVTTRAYRTITASVDVPPSDRAAAIRRSAPPYDLAAAIGRAYTELGGGVVAVRSSATTEDLASAAFAGQHDTVLGVDGADAVVSAVVDCWASLWSDRAIEYRERHGVDHADAAMAVVVQRLVPAESAGVMFTVDPVTGDRVTIVDASPGLGESVVSGTVTPDRYVVARGRLRSFTPGRRERVIRAGADGGVTETQERPTGERVLDDAALRRLVRIGERIARRFGAPQDVEWALADGRIHIVQSRPITTVPPPGRVHPMRRVTAAMFSELTPVRPYPLDVTAWTAPMFDDGVRVMFSAMGPDVDPLRCMISEEDGVLVSLEPPLPRVSPLTPFRLLRNARRCRRYSREAMEAHPLLIEARSIVDSGRRVDPAALDYADLDVRLTEALTVFPLIMRLRGDFMPRLALDMVRFGAALAIFGRIGLFWSLMAGVEHKTAEANRALEDLASLVRADPTLREAFRSTPPSDLVDDLPASFAERFADFLAAYGTRETTILTVSSPTWGDDPALVIAAIAAMAADEPRTGESGSASAERRLFSHPLLRRGPARRVMRRLLATARGFTQFREDTHFYSTTAQPIVRRLLLEYGRRWVEAGALDDPFDVFLLRREELAEPPSDERAATLRAIADRRRPVYERLRGRPLVDRRYLRRTRTRGDSLVEGTSGSAGVATGTVRVITSLSDADRLRPGDVLVAGATNPAWTPLFGRCSAVVTDTGGAASHAAIVAREYGVPAVLGTVTATTTLRDGMSVTVDGDRGVVTAAVR